MMFGNLVLILASIFATTTIAQEVPASDLVVLREYYVVDGLNLKPHTEAGRSSGGNVTGDLVL